MLAMTQSAAEAVEAIVAGPEVPAGAVLRIVAEEGHGNGSEPSRELELELVSQPHARDLVVEDMHVSVEPRSLPFLDDKVLDAEFHDGSFEFSLYSQADSHD